MSTIHYECAHMHDGAVVLTTHERSSFFTSVLGDDIDLRLNPKQLGPLDDVLHNIIVAGGTFVIIDEAFFMDVDDMALGLERFFTSEANPHRLKIIVVCARRKKDDVLLSFLVGFCGIYNIIYDASSVEMSIRLCSLLERDNARTNVIDLIDSQRWENVKHLEDQSEDERERPLSFAEYLESVAIRPVVFDKHFEVEGAHGLHVHVEIEPEIIEKHA